MKAKNKKAIFICQINDGILKLIKCQCGKYSKRKFVDLELESLPPGIDNKKLAEIFDKIFRKMGYSNNPVIISLPRNQATTRYLRVPTQAHKEIERIVTFQAPTYLPYPADELVTGYDILSIDKEGYSYINLIIVHRNAVDRYLDIFQELNIKNIMVILSSYGLCSLYNYIESKTPSPVMVLDIDYQQLELAVVSDKKFLFSRYFRLNRLQDNWENSFLDEVNKTQDAYSKELSKEVPQKMIILDKRKISQEFAEVLNKRMVLPVEILSYPDKINLSQELLNNVLATNNSFASLIGLALGLEELSESLNLLPYEKKEEIRSVSQRKERFKQIYFILSIILLFSLGIAKNLDNKTKYLQSLKTELNKIAKEAKPLDEIEKRFLILERRSEKKPRSLDILYEVHRIVPNQISLINLSYEEDNLVVLRGQSSELKYIFIFVSQIEKSAVFKNFSVKVRYASQKKTQSGEIVDFEIVCSKK